MNLDDIAFNMNGGGEAILGAVLAVIMIGVGLELRREDFRQVARKPAAAVIGLFSLIILLPAATWGLTRLLDVPASVKFGMIVVAACPSGNISNFINYLARGNLALSVSITGVSGVASILTLPLNAIFWAGLSPDTAAILRRFDVDPLSMIGGIVLTLGIPLAIGATIHHFLPRLAGRLRKPLQIASFAFLVLFIIGGALTNRHHIGPFFTFVLPLVALHNAVALGLGFGAARALKLGSRDMRAVMIEVGMHNSALGLALILKNFPGLGGAALIAGGWGLWHLVSGLIVAGFWRRYDRAHALAKDTA